MDVQDGFIVGIFNYCDRWCEACAFTSRCRSFAMEAEMEARLDPSHRALVDAPRRPQDIRKPPEWLQVIMAEAESAIATRDGHIEEPRQSRHEDRPLEQRALDYARRALDRLEAHGQHGAADPGDPWAIIRWFAQQVPSKIGRATRGIANDDGEFRDWPADHDGSAKAAIIGIERSHAAWNALVASQAFPAEEAAAFVTELQWLERALDRAFPRARAFVRPGFDEPEAVARLEAGER
jgi:hypothetical protein